MLTGKNRDNGGKLYKDWRRAVFQKDGCKCKNCSSMDRLEAHHKKSWRDYPSLRYDVKNGTTYCKFCHDLVTNFNKRMKYRKEREASSRGLDERIFGKKEELTKRNRRAKLYLR